MGPRKRGALSHVAQDVWCPSLPSWGRSLYFSSLYQSQGPEDLRVQVRKRHSFDKALAFSDPGQLSPCLFSSLSSVSVKPQWLGQKRTHF